MIDASVRRVVISGIGVVSAAGQTANAFWDSVQTGRTAIRELTDPPYAQLPARLAGRIDGFDHRKDLASWSRDQTILHSDRYAWIAAKAANEAVAQSGLDVPFPNGERAVSIIGSALGGHVTVEAASHHRFVQKKANVHPMTLIRIIGSSASAHIGIEFGAKGTTFGVASAGASAAHAIALGFDHIRRGTADIAIVGGSDCPVTESGLHYAHQTGFVSAEACRPFDANRNGTVLGEAACILILEAEETARARGVQPLAQVCGTGMSFNATDMLTPDPQGAAYAMAMAIKDADLSPGDIGYICASASGSRSGDAAEATAINSVFGQPDRQPPVSSIKAVTGNTLGASAALSSAVCAFAMKGGRLPPSIGRANDCPECRVNVITQAIETSSVKHCLLNCLALGGINASLVIGAYG